MTTLPPCAVIQSIMKALISDIHSNLEAFTAVLAEIATFDVEAIWCLGDVIGYGPNPRECLELVMEHCQVCLLGNHDQAALWDPREFNPAAEKCRLLDAQAARRPHSQSRNRRATLGIPRRTAAEAQGQGHPARSWLAAQPGQ